MKKEVWITILIAAVLIFFLFRKQIFKDLNKKGDALIDVIQEQQRAFIKYVSENQENLRNWIKIHFDSSQNYAKRDEQKITRNEIDIHNLNQLIQEKNGIIHEREKEILLINKDLESCNEAHKGVNNDYKNLIENYSEVLKSNENIITATNELGRSTDLIPAGALAQNPSVDIMLNEMSKNIPTPPAYKEPKTFGTEITKTDTDTKDSRGILQRRNWTICE